MDEDIYLIVSGNVFVGMGGETGRRIEVIQSRFRPAAHLEQVARIGKFARDLDILTAGAVQEIG